jgi:hypothetical protein
MKKAVEFILIIIFSCAVSHAQQAVSTAGGQATGSGGTVSYTIGQLDYITVTGSAGLAMEGVQVPFEVLVPTGIEKYKEISLGFLAYPNPVKDLLTLRIQRETLENLSYKLLDADGKTLQVGSIADTETGISFEDCLPNTYFLLIFQNNLEIKTFKIIKH